MRDFTIRTMEDLMEAVETFGFLPLFQNSIPGFSVEEHAAPSAWFSGDPGVWEWKGNPGDRLCLREVFREKGGVYQRGVVSRLCQFPQRWV